MRLVRLTGCVRSATLLIALTLVAGCGEKAEPAAPPATVTQPAPAPVPGSAKSGARRPEANGGAHPAASGGARRGPGPARIAAGQAAHAYRAYIAAIDARDGERLCGLVPGLEQALEPPVNRGSCGATMRASIGYRDPRGYPVWAETTLSSIEGHDVDLGAGAARITAAIVTRFADRSEPSVESDIAYLQRRGGRWRLEQPTGALYRAIGRPEPPPSAIAPP